MAKFWDLFAESIIVQSFITGLLVTGVLFMWVTGREVPSDLVSATMLALGFWFGSKTQHAITDVLKTQVRGRGE